MVAQAVPLAVQKKDLWMPSSLPILPMLVWLCWRLPRTGLVSMPTGPNGTLWSMLTLAPITTESTFISEVRKLDNLSSSYLYFLNFNGCFSFCPVDCFGRANAAKLLVFLTHKANFPLHSALQLI